MYMQTCAVAVGAVVYANTACAFTDIASAVGTDAAAAAALLPTFTKIMTLSGQKV